MPVLLHSRFFPLSVFVVIAALVVVAFQLYPPESTQSENTESVKSYSFEEPDQLE